MGENTAYFNQQQQQQQGQSPTPAHPANMHESTGLPPPPPPQAQYQMQPQMIMVPAGAVPAGHACIDGGAHNWAKDYTLCGICWLIWCFPCGLLCCYLNADQKCTKCQQVIS
ncbi:hypothetical protein BDF22DRAFT_693008 [Syncephalis plumigaleata]|nr:hypothetical protein BDF22DRAFT_693008 [Syncephalis plumigaleata]